MSHFICSGVGLFILTLGFVCVRGIQPISSSKPGFIEFKLFQIDGFVKELKNLEAILFSYFLVESNLGSDFFIILVGFQSFNSSSTESFLLWAMRGNFLMIFFLGGSSIFLQVSYYSYFPILKYYQNMIQQPSDDSTFRKVQSFSSKQMIVNYLPQTTIERILESVDQEILTNNFRRRHSKQLQIRVFRFQIQHDNRQWEIQKRLSQFIDFVGVLRKKYAKDTPSLPVQKQSDINESNVNHISESLLVFLKRVLQLSQDDEETSHFFELLPVKYGSGIIFAEVCLYKHSGGRHTQATCGAKLQSTFCCCCRTWRKRFFTVTDHCVFYTINKKTYDIKEMLPFSTNFKYFFGEKKTGFQLGIILESAYRTLQLKATSVYDYTLFISSLIKSLANSPYSKSQRYQSFAGVRDNCYSKFYIDGQNYFKDVCQALLKAQKYVYITDWMLTPYILLQRPKQLDDRSSRLDYVLETIGQRGVKVYIILYMQPQIALNNDSKFVQSYLEGMNKNISVLRHPNYILIPFLWSHHQKIIVIDQKCAFLGGLDLCYGRWDTQKHYLTNQNDLWKGADFCNFRIGDIYKPRNFLICNLEKQPRMPWHDIGIQIRGPSVIDLTRHFVQYWNFVSFQTRFNERELLLQSGHSYEAQRRRTTFFSNFSLKQKMLPEEQIHNPSMKTIEQESQQKEYYEHFMEETNLKFTLQIPQISIDKIKQYPSKLYHYIKEGEDRDNLERLLLHTDNNNEMNKKGQQQHQIIRSASTWSLGLQQDNYEQSIYLAYQDLIRQAKQFIYIQNQFFICKTNIICGLLAERIIKAYRRNEKFKVILMMPLLPGFEGNVAQDSAAVMRIQLNWEYVTILRSKNSLFARIAQIPNPQAYLQVLSLRNHALLKQMVPATQILYIHSKLMIVDDCKLILGSANINDRSLLGDRDSQIGIVVGDKNLIKINKGERLVSESIHKLRCQLYQEHFSISLQQAEDYHNENIWNLIAKRAKKNTILYRQLFGCYPDDTMKSYKDIDKMSKIASKAHYDELKDQIIGFVVQWPMKFLQSQDLTLKPNQKQFFVPDINFT